MSNIKRAKYKVKTANGYEQFYLQTDVDSIVGLPNVAKTGDYNDLINKPSTSTSIREDILPEVEGLNIGSPEKRFKGIYVDEAYLSTNTLYLGDTPVMGTESDTIMIRSDRDQSINMRTTGVGASKIISESNVELSTSGPNADVIVQAKGQGSRAVLSAENSVEMNAKQVKIAAEVLLEGHTRTKSMTVEGDLVVSGESFTVNTTTVTTKDNIIEINKGQVGNGVSAGQAGLRVDRGDAEDFLMVFDETDDRFKVGTANSLQTLATQDYVGVEINKNKHTHSNLSILEKVGEDSNGKLTFSGGIVKGDKGDTGAKGEQGLVGPKGEDGLTTSVTLGSTKYTHSNGNITLPAYPTLSSLGGATSGHDHNTQYEPKNTNIQAHISSAHAPSTAQKNSDITKAEIEAKLIGAITTHTHAYETTSGAQAKANTAETNAKNYADTKIAEVVGGAPEALNTLKELGDALTAHESEYDALLTTVGGKANASDLVSHTGDATVHITAAERMAWNSNTKPTPEEIGASPSNHTNHSTVQVGGKVTLQFNATTNSLDFVFA